MALIKCTGCGHDVSDKATECPHCGCPISQENHLTLQIAGYNAKTAETLINKRISVVLCWLMLKYLCEAILVQRIAKTF